MYRPMRLPPRSVLCSTSRLGTSTYMYIMINLGKVDVKICMIAGYLGIYSILVHTCASAYYISRMNEHEIP